MEAAADVIVHSTRGHFAQRKQSHLERMLAGFARWDHARKIASEN